MYGRSMWRRGGGVLEFAFMLKRVMLQIGYFTFRAGNFYSKTKLETLDGAEIYYAFSWFHLSLICSLSLSVYNAILKIFISV